MSACQLDAQRSKLLTEFDPPELDKETSLNCLRTGEGFGGMRKADVWALGMVLLRSYLVFVGTSYLGGSQMREIRRQEGSKFDLDEQSTHHHIAKRVRKLDFEKRLELVEEIVTDPTLLELLRECFRDVDERQTPGGFAETELFWGTKTILENNNLAAESPNKPTSFSDLSIILSAIYLSSAVLQTPLIQDLLSFWRRNGKETNLAMLA